MWWFRPTPTALHRQKSFIPPRRSSPTYLLEKFPITLDADKTQAVWITLSIPSAAKPGDYHGQLVLKVGGIETGRDAFTLHVAAATVPAQQTLKVSNWFYLSDRQLRSQYGVQQLTEGWWTILGNIGRVMAEHRQNMISTPLTGFYFSKLALIGAHAGTSGLEYDFTNFDRWVSTFQKAGLIGSIEGSHVLRREENPDDPAHLKVDVYVLEDGKAALKALPADDPRAEAGLRPMLVALRQHLQERGWLGIYYQHVLDEVGENEMPVYQRYAAIVHESMPGIRTMDAVDARRNLDIYEKSCNVWVPVLGSFDALVPRLHQHVANGGEAWFYTCLFPTGKYANRFIDYALIKTRLLQWFNFRYNLTGFLHWGGNYWSPNPILDTQPLLGESWETGIIPPGDAFIVYPDQEHESILSSIRLEAMRESIEDYELLRVSRVKIRTPRTRWQRRPSTGSPITCATRRSSARSMENFWKIYRSKDPSTQYLLASGRHPRKVSPRSSPGRGHSRTATLKTRPDFRN